jgi:hypothetical protein
MPEHCNSVLSACLDAKPWLVPLPSSNLYANVTLVKLPLITLFEFSLQHLSSHEG